MRRQCRQAAGNSLTIMIITVSLVVVPLLVVLGQIGIYIVHWQRAQNVVEAAGLLAANDLSRIIIDDPNFGYVSLSCHPAIGQTQNLVSLLSALYNRYFAGHAFVTGSAENVAEEVELSNVLWGELDFGNLSGRDVRSQMH